MTMQSRSPLRAAGRCSAHACRSGGCGASLGLASASLDRLMPMHLIVALDGAILRAGPTIAKLCGGADVAGRPFLSLFDFRLPRDVASVADLLQGSDRPLRLSLRDKDRTGLKGQAAPLDCGKAVLIDLSFGISVVDAVRRFSLTSADFGGTDLGIELLFLVEAQRAALAETRRFSRRLESARVAAERDATTDRLTGARNRRAMDHMLADLIERRQAFGVIHLDIDGFKAVNELCGHPGGDAILREVANGLFGCVRPGDMAARTGGDEFVLILPGVSSVEEAEDVGRRILERLEMPVLHEDKSFRLRVSLGGAISGHYASPDADDILRDADAALFAAKRAGGGRFYLHPRAASLPLSE